MRAALKVSVAGAAPRLARYPLRRCGRASLRRLAPITRSNYGSLTAGPERISPTSNTEFPVTNPVATYGALLVQRAWLSADVGDLHRNIGAAAAASDGN